VFCSEFPRVPLSKVHPKGFAFTSNSIVFYIQTRNWIGYQSLISTPNSKHTQTTTLELEAISFPSLIWNYQSNLSLDSILCIQTERKRNSMQMLLRRDWHQLPKPYMRAPCSFNMCCIWYLLSPSSFITLIMTDRRVINTLTSVSTS
jgi:hypothetical protein